MIIGLGWYISLHDVGHRLPLVCWTVLLWEQCCLKIVIQLLISFVVDVSGNPVLTSLHIQKQIPDGNCRVREVGYGSLVLVSFYTKALL